MTGERRDDPAMTGAEGPGRRDVVDPADLATPAASAIAVDGPDSVSQGAALADGHDGPRLRLDDDAVESRPWLEAAGDASEPEVSSTKLALLGVLGLLIIATIVGGLWHLQSGGRKGREELIAAQPGDYKVRPADSGARKFDGEGSARYAASEGLSPSGRIDPARVSEEPATTTPGPSAPDAGKGAAAAVAVAVGGAPASQPAAIGGGMVQLGAFGSAASAQQSWAGLQKRFAYLAPLSSSVTPVTRNGRTVHRLRVSTGSVAAADALCQRLKVAGESCIRVD